MTSSEILEGRRARVVNRARTSAVTRPTEGLFGLIDWLQTAPAEMFSTDLVDVTVDTEDVYNPEYWVDGHHLYSKVAAVSLLQDRYGISTAEAEALIPTTGAPRQRPRGPSSVTPIGGGR